MDSVKEITKQMPPKMKTCPTSSNEERKSCPHGEQVRVNDDGSLCLWECSKCCAEEKQKDELRAQMTNREVRYSQIMYGGSEYGNIPRRFASKTLDNYSANSAKQRKVADLCRNYVSHFEMVKDQGTSMVFCGKPGTGKTHLAYAIVNVLQAIRVTAVVRTAADMTSEVKEAYKSDHSDVTPTTVAEKFAHFDLLVIDEVGVQVSSDAEKRIFFNIINKRYENMLPTILISNLALKELTEFVGERVVDRMRENRGVVFAFDWGSYRKQQH